MAAKKKVLKVAHFLHSKETKNMHRYDEVDEAGKPIDRSDASLVNIYIMKTVTGNPAPDHLKITIEDMS